MNGAPTTLLVEGFLDSTVMDGMLSLHAQIEKEHVKLESIVSEKRKRDEEEKES